MKYLKLTREQAQLFYFVHRERPFYNDLVEFMTSGPIVAAILQKDNAVEAYRSFIGSTNPRDAAQGTIRALYGTNIQENAVHGSTAMKMQQKKLLSFSVSWKGFNSVSNNIIWRYPLRSVINISLQGHEQ